LLLATGYLIMFIVVAYDIADDKRRNRLHKTLMRFGEPVQFSVFECILTESQFDQMRREVARVVEVPDNNVRFYELCDTCHGRTVSLGRGFTTSIPTAYIL
jgi:CRISPR-associated protein Cas2